MPVSLSNISWHKNGSKDLPYAELFFPTLFIILALYNIKEPVSIPFIKLPFAIAVLTAWTFLPRPFYHPVFWASLLAYFSILLVKDFYGVANHHFVACYILIALIQYTAVSRHDDELLKFHIRFILMMVLLLSAVQKLLSPSYTNGTFFQFEMYMDIFLNPMKWVVPGWQKAVEENLEAYKQLRSVYPSKLETIILQEPIRHAAVIAKLCSWFAIIIEALAGIALFVKSSHRISHVLLLATIAGVFFFRQETGFLAMLSCMGLLLAPGKSWRNTWLFCFIVFAAMVATGAGLR
jgi:hypothetical protein